jgi:hypothetical protein
MINALHLHMFNIGILTITQMLVLYPAENVVSIAAKAVVAVQAKGDKK